MTEVLLSGREDGTGRRVGRCDNGCVIESPVNTVWIDCRFGDSDIEGGVAQTVVGRDGGGAAKDELRLKEVFSEPTETLQTEVGVTDGDVFIRVAHVVFPDAGSTDAPDNSVTHLPGSGHQDLLEQKRIHVVVVGSAIGSTEVEDDSHFTGLRNGEDGVATKVRERWSLERASSEAGLDPANDVVSNLLPVSYSRWSFTNVEGRERRGKLAGGGAMCEFLDGKAAADELSSR